MDLKETREQIDEIDEKIVELLKKRFDCSLEVAQYKKKKSLPILDSEREKQIISKVKDLGGEHGDSIAAVYEEIMSASKKLQEKAINGK